MPAGRFAGERYFPEREHVPQWLWDMSPRVSMAYDLFGNGRTALKASFSRYLDPLTGGFADRYSPGAGNETRNWFDCTINAAGNACATGVSTPTDGDDIAQAHEIGPGGATFGIREDRDFDPAIQRERNTEITFGVQHQLFSRVSVIAQYYNRTFQDMEMLDRELITQADYTLVPGAASSRYRPRSGRCGPDEPRRPGNHLQPERREAAGLHLAAA